MGTAGESPLACSLSPDELRRRLLEWRALRAEQVERQVAPGHFSARYSKRRGVAERLEQLVEAERHCCPFLAIQLHDEGELSAREVTGPDGAEAALPNW